MAAKLVPVIMLLGLAACGGSDEPETLYQGVWDCDDGTTATVAQREANTSLFEFSHSSGWSSVSEYDELLVDAENFGCEPPPDAP